MGTVSQRINTIAATSGSQGRRNIGAFAYIGKIGGFVKRSGNRSLFDSNFHHVRLCRAAPVGHAIHTRKAFEPGSLGERAGLIAGGVAVGNISKTRGIALCGGLPFVFQVADVAAWKSRACKRIGC